MSEREEFGLITLETIVKLMSILLKTSNTTIAYTNL